MTSQEKAQQEVSEKITKLMEHRDELKHLLAVEQTSSLSKDYKKIDKLSIEIQNLTTQIRQYKMILTMFYGRQVL